MNLGNLYIVSTPIGNYNDITIRAARILKECDYIVCEEFKEAAKLLKFLNLKKELLQLNEHNEQTGTEEIFSYLLEGNSLALISDCGAPGFADPGKRLINKCIDFNIKIDFIPGANSLLAALVISGFDISRFYYLGFLSPKSQERKYELSKLLRLKKTTALLETPYRLQALLEDISILSPERKLFIGMNLTMKNEMKFRGTAREILNSLKTHFGDVKVKEEFVLIIDKPRSN